MPKRTRASLACERCGRRNYRIRPARPGADRLALRKYCPQCGRHTLHREER